MGKSKKRIFNKNLGLKGTVLKREKLVAQVLADIKCNKLSDETKRLAELFGITAEELSEAGAEFEELSLLF